MKGVVILAAVAAAIYFSNGTVAPEGTAGSGNDRSTSWDSFFGFINVAKDIAKGRQPPFIDSDSEKRRQLEQVEAEAQRKRQAEIDAEAERQKRANVNFFDSLNAQQRQIQQQAQQQMEAAEAERRKQQLEVEAMMEAENKKRQQAIADADEANMKRLAEIAAVEAERKRSEVAEAAEAERKRVSAASAQAAETETEEQRRQRIFARGGSGAQQVGAMGAAAGSAILLLATADHSAFESRVASCPAGYDDTGAFCTKWRVTGQVCADDCSKGWDSCRRRGAFGECWGGCRESCSPVKVVEETLEKRNLPCPADFPFKRSGLCYRK